MGLVWGIPCLLIKVAVEEFTPSSLVLLRTGVAAALLLPVAASRGQLRGLRPHWRALLAFAAVEIAVPWYLLADAERHMTSSLAGLLVAAVPLAGARIALATPSDERLDGRQLAGLLVGLAGVAALVGLDVGTTSVVALVEMAGVVVAYAVGPFILTRWLSGVPGLGVIAASLTLTALAYAPVGLAQMPPDAPSAEVFTAVLVLALLCTALAFLLFFALIAEVGPVRSVVITYVNPAVAVAVGVALLDEPFTPGIAAGFALILLGSVLATRRAPAAAVPAPRGPGADEAAGSPAQRKPEAEATPAGAT